MSGLLAQLVNWILAVVESLGYVGLTFLVMAETIFPPLPSEAILPAAGILASQDRLSLGGVLVATTLGSVLGAIFLYWCALAFGESRLRRFVDLYGKWFLVDNGDLDKAQAWFNRYGGVAVFVGRLVPLIRSLVSLPAGIARMPFWRFSAYTATGSGLWNAFLVGCGFLLGEQWHLIRPYTRLLEIGVVAGIVLLAAVFLWRRRNRVFALAQRPVGSR